MTWNVEIIWKNVNKALVIDVHQSNYIISFWQLSGDSTNSWHVNIGSYLCVFRAMSLISIIIIHTFAFIILTATGVM